MTRTRPALVGGVRPKLFQEQRGPVTDAVARLRIWADVVDYPRQRIASPKLYRLQFTGAEDKIKGFR